MKVGEDFDNVEYEFEGYVPRKGAVVAGLDIGTTKTCCMVGEIKKDSVEVVGVGFASSKGIKKGVIVNIGSTVESIKTAVEKAEMDAHCKIERVYVGIAGNHIKGFNSPGILAIDGKEITEADVDEVIRGASTVKITGDHQIIHVLPQEYMVDDKTGIQDPLGMLGVRLVTNVHIVTAEKDAVHNLYNCCSKAGLEVSEMVLESIASAQSVMDHDELEMGAVLVDIGGGTTDVAVFCDGTIRHTFEIGVGGHNLTNDLSVGLRTTLQDAEYLKEEFGSCIPDLIKPNVVVEVPDIGEREPQTVTQRTLVEIIEARIGEILEMVNDRLVDSGLKKRVNGGVILTGGTALLANINDLAEQIFDLPVRTGYPTKIHGKHDQIFSPRCTTGAGLVLYGWEKEKNRKRSIKDPWWKSLKRESKKFLK